MPNVRGYFENFRSYLFYKYTPHSFSRRRSFALSHSPPEKPNITLVPFRARSISLRDSSDFDDDDDDGFHGFFLISSHSSQICGKLLLSLCFCNLDRIRPAQTCLQIQIPSSISPFPNSNSLQIDRNAIANRSLWCMQFGVGSCFGRIKRRGVERRQCWRNSRRRVIGLKVWAFTPRGHGSWRVSTAAWSSSGITGWGP